MAYPGITTKKLKDGSKNIYVNFKYKGKRYPTKNFTKLFGIKLESKAFEKLQEIKVEINKGNDPFNPKGNSLNEIFDKRKEDFLEIGKWKKETTYTNYTTYYDKFIRKTIGHLKLNKITYEHLEDIKMTVSKTGCGPHYINNMKIILNPIFKEAVKKKQISENVCDLIEKEKVPKRESLHLRTNEDELLIARKIYRHCFLYESQWFYQRDEIKNYLCLLLMSGRRVGELLQLKRSDIDLENMKGTSRKEITKTKITDEWPVPVEVVDFIKTKNGDELLFSHFTVHAVYNVFQRLLNMASVERNKTKNLSPHDTRNLLLNVMIRDGGIDSALADFCLSHKQRGVIGHYLNFNYKDKVKAFNIYWDLLREEDDRVEIYQYDRPISY